MKVKYLQFWLSWNNNTEKLRLPVLPERISVMTNQNHIDIDLVALGEATIIGDPTLKEYSFESIWPEMYDPGICDYAGFPSPEEFSDTIARWRETRYPIRFIVADIMRGNVINTPASIREFNYDWDGFDNEFSITLIEYKFITLQRTNVNLSFQTPKVTRPDTRAAGVSSTKKKDKDKKESLVDKYLNRGKPSLK